jgi:hypothetical protein
MSEIDSSEPKSADYAKLQRKPWSTPTIIVESAGRTNVKTADTGDYLTTGLPYGS